ncbi:MAG: hypothetical protein ACI4XL_12500 [Bacillus sp. (in: firmicutes)]
MNSFFNTYCQVSEDDTSAVQFEIKGTELLVEEKVSRFLHSMKETYEADDFCLPASFTGVALLGPLACMMIESAKRRCFRELSLKNFSLQLGLLNGSSPYLQVKIDSHAPTRPSETLQPMLAEHLTANLVAPIESIASQSAVKSSLIWQQYGARLLTIMEAYRKIETDESVHIRLADYHNYVAKVLPACLFHLRKNPFLHTPEYIDNPYQPGEKMMIRSGCCMFYKRKNGVTCYNCPAMSHSDRNPLKKDR